MRFGFYLVCIALLMGTLIGCRSPTPSPLSATTSASRGVTPKLGAFVNVTEQVGIDFRQLNGAAGKFLLVETTPGGCAFLDYDQDGWPDIFFVQSGPPPDMPPNTPRLPCKLYHNEGDGTFRDVTHEASLDRLNQGYAQGVAVGDYDNDGYPDIFLTGYGGCRLLHNRIASRNSKSEQHSPLFEDVTEKAGVGDTDQGERWATGAAWGDYDRDGNLDLIVLRYAKWSPAEDKRCQNALGHRTYCSPEVYPGDTPRLFRGDGKGRFTDVSRRMGIDKVRGRGLGVVWLDYDQDGWSDIFIACDITPNLLLHNLGGTRFEEVGTSVGVAYGPDAATYSGMGIGVGDFDNKGWESLVVTNFSGQPNTVYRAIGEGRYVDATYATGIGQPSIRYLAWGVEFFDYDNDGWLDLVVGNGHVDPFVAETSYGTTYAERKLLFRNEGNGTFRDCVEDLGDLAEERVTRGLAIGDFDNDGRLDILDNSHNMPARLYRNVKLGGKFVTLRLEGTKSNRDALGAQVWVNVGGENRMAEVRAGSSYASTSDRRLHFGLGSATHVEKIKIRWPSGLRQTFTDLAAGHFYYLREGANPVRDPLIRTR
jgi:hypothetical protein